MRVKATVKFVRYHWQLDVYKLAFEAAMEIYRASKSFPTEEKYALTDQVRRSSRSVAAQIAEAWRRRKYVAAFVSKLNDAEGEAAETQSWLQFAVECGIMDRMLGKQVHRSYDQIMGKLVNMGNNPEQWALTKTGVKR